jgi:uncharacterized membrane protein
MPVDVQLEFFARSPWWVPIGAVTGASLLVSALLARRADSRLAKPAALAGVATLGLTGVLAYVARVVPGTSLLLDSVLLVFLLVALGGAVALFYRNQRAILPRRRRVTLTGLRVAGITALMLLLFRPSLAIFQGGAPAKPRLAVVLDASASMGYNDAPNQPNRFRQSAIAVQNALAPRLADTYDLQVFAYDGKHAGPLASPGDLDAITPDGTVTDLPAAIASAAASSSTDTAGKLAAAVLFSDGIHNGPVAVEGELSNLALGIPVHTVRVGSSDLEASTVPDIAVTGIDGPQTAVVNNGVTLTVSIKSTAMSDRTVRVGLYEKPTTAPSPGTPRKPLDEGRLVLRSGAIPQTVQLKFTPDKVGRAVVRVEVPVDPGERSDANNQQDFALLVTDPKLGVLYVEGRVRPEVGPLRRAIEQDPNLTALSLVQTAAGRFEMSGSMVNEKLGAGPNAEPLRGLPTTLAQWKRFKVILLGDLDASFLSPQQQRDLEQTVRDGAGLLMIGGQNSFAPGGWGKTTLASLLPVSLDPVTPPQINAPFVPRLTAQGVAHPIFRSIAPYFLAPDGSRGQTTVPDLSGCVALASPKPGATVLAVHPTQQIRGEPAIVLAVQNYGKGRTAAFAADTTWRWSLFLRAMQKDSPYNRFWGQTLRWLASEENLEQKTGASVTAMLAKERFDAGEDVPLRAAVTDKAGQATNYADVSATVTGPDNAPVRVSLAALSTADGGGTPGLYGGPFKPTMSGTYRVTFAATKDGADLGKDNTTFTVLAAAGERDVLAANPRTLETIARTTAGTAVALEGVDALADRLLAAAPRTPQAAATQVPLYHPRGFFLMFLALITVEWLLRRRWQLQ